MSWLRIEDGVTEHRKHLRAGPAACWLWVCGIAYCQRQLSDGFIPEEAVTLLGVVKGAKALADVLVTVGLFERVHGGYLVHDYHDYNDTREQALQRRTERHDAKVKAGQAGAAKRWQTDSRPIADGNSRAIAPSHPIPSHPDPKEDQERAFVQFMAVYPKQTGRKDAGELWHMLAPGPELQDRIMAGAQAYANHVADWEPRFIKAPAKWLSGAHWDDEIKQPNRPGLVKSTAFECPHEPKCWGRNDCHVKQQIAAARAI